MRHTNQIWRQMTWTLLPLGTHQSLKRDHDGVFFGPTFVNNLDMQRLLKYEICLSNKKEYRIFKFDKNKFKN